MNDISTVAEIVAMARSAAGLSQRELAARARTTQAAVARIEGGRTSPTMKTLARLAHAAGFELRIELVTPSPSLSVPDAIVAAYKRDIDRSLLRENLKKTVDERVRSLSSLVRLAGEARRAGRVVRQRARSRK